MIIVNAWKRVVLENYARFSGRAGRAEFWWFVLANLIVSIVFNVLASAADFFFILSFVYSLGVLIPSIAVAIRRLHDTNRSGWWLLIGLIPIVGWIILIVFYATPGNPGPNQYGAPEPWPTATAALV